MSRKPQVTPETPNPEVARIRERLLDIESEMEAESEAHNESESTEEWPTVQFQRLDNELQALRRRLAKVDPPHRRAKEAA